MQGSAAAVRRRAGLGHGLARDRVDPSEDGVVRSEREPSVTASCRSAEGLPRALPSWTAVPSCNLVGSAHPTRLNHAGRACPTKRAT